MWDCNCLSLLDFNSLGTEIRSYYHGIFDTMAQHRDSENVCEGREERREKKRVRGRKQGGGGRRKEGGINDSPQPQTERN